MDTAIPERVKHWGRLAGNREYRVRHREFQRIRHLPRYTKTATDLLGKQFELVDSVSFLAIYQDIFEREIYRFQTVAKKPLIIDGGANVGLSVIYFKQLYPHSQVIAFEPDPEIFSVLQRNCEVFGLQDVTLVPKALWSSETVLSFLQEGGEAGRIPHAGDSGKVTAIQTSRLRDFLATRIDLLKIDIEGAEAEVLRDCADKLENVQHLFVEYHSFADEPQTLAEIISIINQAGFRLYLQTLLPSLRPFVKRNVSFGMDFQANIFAFRV